MDMLRQRILEAVDSLRVRKCRPDRETIAHFVLRKYGAQYTEIFSELENIVDEGLLLKVEYKGTTSYRSPSSFDLKSSPLLTKHSKILNSARTTRMILTAVSDLLSAKDEYTKVGIPPEELHEKLIEVDDIRFTKENVELLISREVSCGSLQIGGPFKIRVYPKDIVIQVSKDTSADEEIPKKRGRKKVAATQKIEENVEKDDDEAVDTVTPIEVKSPVVSAIRNVVAEKVAAAVRKTYEGMAGVENMKIGESSVDQSKEKSGNKIVGRQDQNVTEEMENPVVAPVKRSLASRKNIKITGKVRGKNATAIVKVEADVSKNEVESKTILDTGRKEKLINAKDIKVETCTEVKIEKVKDEEPKGRSSQRDKRKRKVFDPSDLKDPSPPPPKKKAPQKKKNKSDNSSLCEYCQRHKNIKGEDEEFLVCNNCDATMHPSCMDYNEKLAIRLRMNTWLCFDCKICDICQVNTNSGGDGELLCESCDKSYHVKCLQLPEKPKERWICDECIYEDKKAVGSDVKVKEEIVESEIPDASAWTPKQVEEYFIMKGLPDEASVFKEQEIDGLSLLLMRRADVIFGLRLRLGPALKVYRLIHELQTKTPYKSQ